MTRKPTKAPVRTITDTLQDRGAEYGAFADHADITIKIKDAIHAHLNHTGVVLAPDQLEALHMIAHKIGRIVNGNPDNVDNWHDIAGYATLVEKRLEGTTL